jgi:hypothetical protein
MTRVRLEPGEIAFAYASVIGAGDKAATNELHRHIEIVGELLSGLYQIAFDLDATGRKVQHGGQTGYHSEAAAPFTEETAARQAAGQCP